jgi:hypothetical protein
VQVAAPTRSAQQQVAAVLVQVLAQQEATAQQTAAAAAQVRKELPTAVQAVRAL